MSCGGNCACASKDQAPMCNGDGNCARPDCPCKQKKADEAPDTSVEMESSADTEETKE